MQRGRHQASALRAKRRLVAYVMLPGIKQRMVTPMEP